MAADILIVDDESDIRLLIAGILGDEGYQAREAADSDSALVAIETRVPALLILDIWLQGSKLDGLEILDVASRCSTTYCRPALRLMVARGAVSASWRSSTTIRTCAVISGRKMNSSERSNSSRTT